MAFGRKSTANASRFTVWVESSDPAPDRVVTVAAILMGLDKRAARRFIESGAPVRKKASPREVRRESRRFAHWGVGIRVEPKFPWPLYSKSAINDRDLPVERTSERGSAKVRQVQMMVGALVGGISGCTLLSAFGPKAFATEIGRFELYLAPLLTSCGVGIVWCKGLRGFVIPMQRVAGVIALIAVLLFLELRGSRAIVRWFDDADAIQSLGPFAAFLFVAFCVAAACPSTAAIAHGAWKKGKALKSPIADHDEYFVASA
jgi:hypothetical protein